jgi:ABC-type proline/glycine betaine transport system ATPase subunit
MTTIGSRTAFPAARGLPKDYVMGEVVVHALMEVDLEIYAGELVVLLRLSSSGKFDTAQHSQRSRHPDAWHCVE